MSSSDEGDSCKILSEDSDAISQQANLQLQSQSQSSPRHRHFSSSGILSGDFIDDDDDDAYNDQDSDGVTLPAPPRRKKVVSKRYRDESLSEAEEEGLHAAKKSKYKIYTLDEGENIEETYVGATQAECMPDSSPYRIRGPIYKKPRAPQPIVKVQPVASTIARAAPTRNENILVKNSAPTTLPIVYRGNSTSTVKLPEKTGPTILQNSVKSKPKEVNTSEAQKEVSLGDNDLAGELDDLPSDAFSSSPESLGHQTPSEPVGLPSSTVWNTQKPRSQQRLVAPQTGLQQMTLFGGRASQGVTPASQSQGRKALNFLVDKPAEPPTHHVLNTEELKTWIYPTNLGATRDYQFSTVSNGLFNNTLVALPTGLGKTFIAATIMLNYYRWTANAQIVFVAPTKPLVAQQVEACFQIAGIPRSTTTMLTGGQKKALRDEEWQTKRVFFMTPQTLLNDLSSGSADPKRIVLLVVDEAHRATGDYSYVKVVKFMRRFSSSFRVLALTATPGATAERVQEVIDALEISSIEVRTEESIDIAQYVHRRDELKMLLDPSDEMILLKELFSKALQPLVDKLCTQNAYYNKDPMSMTPYGMIKAKQAWFLSEAGRKAPMGVKGMINGLFTILQSMAQSIKLLNYHGIGPFYSKVKAFRDEAEGGKDGGGKYKKQIAQSPEFQEMMRKLALWMSTDGFVGHPKLSTLCDTVLNHFLDAGDGRLAEGAPRSSTRVIVFSEYRESAEDITRTLNKHRPMVRASVFVGQADSKNSAGMNQKTQQEVIGKFKDGEFNVLVATSIGEEGLDIGQVDLIVCYDASGSPIRMLQRMGRTGRKRAGTVVLLLMRGKEEESYAQSKDKYELMQKALSSGKGLNLRYDLSARILPRDIRPTVVMRDIEIPEENLQDSSLPVPRGTAKATKKRAKTFHMPDNVETGFRKASNLADFGITVEPKKSKKTVPTEEPIPIPDLESVLLSRAETHSLERLYQNVAGNDLQEVTMPDVTCQTVAQRSLGRTAKVPHGEYTKRSVQLFQKLANSQSKADRFLKLYGEVEPELKRRSLSASPEPKKDNHSKPKSNSTKTGINQKQPPPPKTSVKYAPPSHKMRKSTPEHDVDPFDSLSEDSYNFIQSSPPSDSFNSLQHKYLQNTTAQRKNKAGKSTPSPKPFYEPTKFTPTQDTNYDDDDEDIPDLGHLIASVSVAEAKITDSAVGSAIKTKLKHSTSSTRAPLVEVGDGDDNPRSLAPNLGAREKRRRRIVIEDDSDE